MIEGLERIKDLHQDLLYNAEDMKDITDSMANTKQDLQLFTG